MNIAIIGRGNVGSALEQGLSRVGYSVKTAGRDPDEIRQLTAWGDVIVFAVPFAAINDVVAKVGDMVAGKVVLDVTNALTADYGLALGCTNSGAEELQRKLPSARVVKAFNTVFAQNQSTGRVKDQMLTLFVAGDDAAAKEQVLAMGRHIGFDAVDAGPLQNARWLETLGYFQIQLGYTLGMGTNIGITLIH
ncbi:MAG: NADPH-dependent F420 reductase [Thiohalomonadaceae bacterium]